MWFIELIKYLGEQVLLEKISPIFFMHQYEKGVLMRAGIFERVLKKGWNFKRPVTDRFLTCTATPETLYISNVNITTEDKITCSVSACFEFVITDEVKFLLEANDALSNIKDISMGCVAGELIPLKWEDINRRKTINEIKKTLNKDLELYGVSVNRFWFTDIVQTRVFTLVNQ